MDDFGQPQPFGGIVRKMRLSSTPCAMLGCFALLRHFPLCSMVTELPACPTRRRELVGDGGCWKEYLGVPERRSGVEGTSSRWTC